MSRVAGYVVLCVLFGVVSADAVAAPPATQPNKVLAKLVVATAKPDSSAITSEPWIAEQTAAAGLPAAVDCSQWTELSSTAKKIDAPRLSSLEFKAHARRDPASKLLMAELSGSRSKSVMLIDRAGQREVIKLDGLPDGRTVFLAIEVVPLSTRIIDAWGSVTNNIRLSLRIDPETWAAKGPIKMTTVFENVAAAQTQTPMWASHQRVPLEIFSQQNKPISPATTPSSNSRSMWMGAQRLMGYATSSVTVTGQWDGHTMTVSSTTGTVWKWKLDPGKYEVRAVADNQDFPYRTGTTGTPFYSQKVAISVSGAASQPDAK